MVTSGNLAQIGALAERDAARALRLGERLLGEFLRDVVRHDADERDRARVAHAPEPLDHAGRLEAEPAMAERLGEHDLARLGLAFLAGRDAPFGLRAAVGGHEPAAAMPGSARKTPSTRPGASVMRLSVRPS